MADEKQRLDSWKEIAQYLGRDVRTVIRWEKEKGLPVHRVPGGRRSAVFAYISDIDSWLAGQATANNSSNPDVRSLESTATQPSADGLLSAASAGWRGRWFALAAVVVVLGVVAAFVPSFLASSKPPVRASISANRLIAWDNDNRKIWEYEFSNPLFTGPAFGPWEHHRTRVVDVDGDGTKEILAVVGFDRDTGDPHKPSSVVFCFSASGRLLWQYEPEISFRFGDAVYSGPWWVTDLAVAPDPSFRVWVAFNHHTWWPAFVARLDGRGNAHVQYVNAGRIDVLGYKRSAQQAYLLAAGQNNEMRSATLAVIPEAQDFAASPSREGSPFLCQTCPAGSPSSYFVFPRSELMARQERPFHHVNTLRVTPEGVAVWTYEGEHTFQEIRAVPGLFVYYEFSGGFDSLTGAPGDLYWTEHRRLERQHRIKHSAESCPDQHIALRVRVWTPENGWAKPQADMAKRSVPSPRSSR